MHCQQFIKNVQPIKKKVRQYKVAIINLIKLKILIYLLLSLVSNYLKKKKLILIDISFDYSSIRISNQKISQSNQSITFCWMFVETVECLIKFISTKFNLLLLAKSMTRSSENSAWWFAVLVELMFQVFCGLVSSFHFLIIGN